MTKAVREEKMAQAVELSARGKPYTVIAEELEVSWPTAKKLVEDELARRGEHRGPEREQAIANYQAIISEGWDRMDRLKDTSQNVTGVLNAIRAAQERIDKLTGAEAPLKYQDVTDTYEIVFDDDLLIEAES